jgi:NAD-dependent dihydropyrimidine dehydrogenase PreA subunit
LQVTDSRQYPCPEIDQEECKGCGLCVASCPAKVLEISARLNSKGYHPSSYKGQGCVGCGNCFYTCPEPGAMKVFLKGYVPGGEE